MASSDSPLSHSMTKKKKTAVKALTGITAAQVPPQPQSNPQPPPFTGSQVKTFNLSTDHQWGQARIKTTTPPASGSQTILTVTKYGYLCTANIGMYFNIGGAGSSECWAEIRYNDGVNDIPICSVNLSYAAVNQNDRQSVTIAPQNFLVRPGDSFNIRYGSVSNQMMIQGGVFIQNIQDFS